MKSLLPYALLSVLFTFCMHSKSNSLANHALKVVLIRHAERPDNGDNLNCKGLNRSLMLAPVLFNKFGIPSKIYIPEIVTDQEVKRSRMLQTISPFAIRYNLALNAAYSETASKKISQAILKQKGTVLVVWEHNNIVPIVSALGIDTHKLRWADDDFDSIWIIDFSGSKAILTKDRMGLNPSSKCPF